MLSLGLGLTSCPVLSRGGSSLTPMPAMNDFIADYDPASLAGSDGANITAWTDSKSGIVAGTQLGTLPVLKLNQDGGAPVVRCAGGGLKMAAPGAIRTAFDSQDFTVLIAFKTRGVPVNGYGAILAAHSLGNPFFYYANGTSVAKYVENYQPIPHAGQTSFTTLGSSSFKTSAIHGSTNQGQLLFVNGGSVATLNAASMGSGGNDICIGTDGGVQSPFVGDIYRIWIWKRALTPAEYTQAQKRICELYSQPYPWASVERMLVFYGDSGIGGYGATDQINQSPGRLAAATLGLEYGQYHVVGIYGIELDDMGLLAPTWVDPLPGIIGKEVGLVTYEWYNQPEGTTTKSAAFVNARASINGLRVIWGTNYDSSFLGPNANRTAYAAGWDAIMAGANVAPKTSVSAYMAFHLDLHIGVDGSYASYSAGGDGIHLTSATYPYLAAWFVMGVRALNAGNFVPNAEIDLNFVEDFHRAGGLFRPIGNLLDFANGNTARTAKNAAGADVAFAGNTIPLTDAGVYCFSGVDDAHKDWLTVRDAIAAPVLAALATTGITVFAEYVVPTGYGAWPLNFRSADDSAWFNAAVDGSDANSIWSGSFSAGNNTDYGAGPTGSNATSHRGSIVRIAYTMRSDHVRLTVSVGDRGQFQESNISLKDFTGGKIWIGSGKFDQFMAAAPVRRVAFALSRRPDAELTAWVQGDTNPSYANLAYVNQINAAAASALPILGVNTHINRRNASDIPAADNLAMARAVGAEAIRLDFGWQTIEPAGDANFVFSYYDATMAAFNGASLPVLMMLGYGHTVHTGSPAVPPSNSAGRNAMGAAGGALANRYPSNAIEVLNEQNLDQFTGTSVNAANTAATTMTVAAAIKAAQPAMKVITNGISSANWEAPKAFATSFWAALTDKSNIDSAAFHPYLIPDGNVAVPEWAVKLNSDMFGIMSGKDKENTEVGFPIQWAGDQDTQARFVARSYLASIRSGLKSHYHYDLADDGPNKAEPEETYGLHDENFVIKPSGRAVKRLSDIKQATTTYSVDQVPGFDLTVVTMNKAAGKTLLLTAEHMATHFVRDIGAHTAVAATDVLGNPIAVSMAGNVVKLPVTPQNCPVILTVQ